MGLELVFEAPWTLKDLRAGPLGWLLDDFCDWLLERGFSLYTARTHVGRVLHLNRWLVERDWHWPGVLSRTEIEGFLETYPQRCRNRGSLEEHLKRIRHSLNRFVEFLSHLDLFDPLLILPLYQPLLNGYLEWMRDHQHASEGTLELRCHSIQLFLKSLGTKATV